MTTQRLKLLRARVALSFYEVYQRRPTDQELDRHVKNARLYHAITPAFFTRRTLKRTHRPQRLG